MLMCAQVAFIEAIAAIGRDKLMSASDVADCLLPNVLANISHAPTSPEVCTLSLCEGCFLCIGIIGIKVLLMHANAADLSQPSQG